MPLTLSGNGTVTGLAVGGLPDGSVDGDTLANTVSTGTVLQVTEGSYSSAVTISGGTAATGLEGTITPTGTNSKILVLVSQSGQYRVNSDPSCVINIYIDRKVASGSYSEICYQQYLGGSFPTNRRSNRITTITKLDTPTYSVGQVLTYRVRAGTYTSNYGLQYNAQLHGSTNPSYIQMLEIAA